MWHQSKADIVMVLTTLRYFNIFFQILLRWSASRSACSFHWLPCCPSHRHSSVSNAPPPPHQNLSVMRLPLKLLIALAPSTRCAWPSMSPPPRCFQDPVQPPHWLISLSQLVIWLAKQKSRVKNHEVHIKRNIYQVHHWWMQQDGGRLCQRHQVVLWDCCRLHRSGQDVLET